MPFIGTALVERFTTRFGPADTTGGWLETTKIVIFVEKLIPPFPSKALAANTFVLQLKLFVILKMFATPFVAMPIIDVPE
jgi:hypothetical protein